MPHFPWNISPNAMTDECHTKANGIFKLAEMRQLCPCFVDNLSGKGACVDVRKAGVWTRFAITDEAEVFLMRYDMRNPENNEVKSITDDLVIEILDAICNTN